MDIGARIDVPWPIMRSPRLRRRDACAIALMLTGCVVEADEAGETGAPAEPPVGEPVGGLVPIDCDPSISRAGPPRVRRLSRSEYNNTVADMLGDATAPADAFLQDPRDVSGFSNFADALRVGATQADQIAGAAARLAVDTANERLDRVFPCGAAQLDDPTCIADFIAEIGRQALRRPLTAEEQARHAELYALGAQTEARGGVRWVLEALLQSPYFLYRSELGDGLPDANGEVRLDRYELASALSYALLATLPDEELLAAAESGALADDDEVLAQARRLLARPEARRGQLEFYRQMFGFEELLVTDKDPAVYPQYLAVRPAMIREMELFIADTLFAADARLGTLLTARYSFIDAGLAALYGVAPPATAWDRAALDPAARAGILTMPGLLAAFGHIDSGSIALRGRFVRERLLCQRIPDPPPGVFDQLPAPAEGQSAREWFDSVTAGAGCSGCHDQMNGIGRGFEQLGGLGEPLLHDEYGGIRPITGELLHTRDIDGPFVGAAALAGRLAASEQVQECMTLQQFRYVLGRDVTTLDGCSLLPALERFTASDLDLNALTLAAVTSRAFLYRWVQ